MKIRDRKSTARCVQKMKKYRMNASKPLTYVSFLGQEFSDYIRKMSKDGEYGDNLTLQAFSREFYNI